MLVRDGEEESSAPQGRRNKQCPGGKGDTRTQMPAAVTLEFSKTRAGCGVLHVLPPAASHPSFLSTTIFLPAEAMISVNSVVRSKVDFFLITPVVCQLPAETSTNTALPAAGSDPLFSSCFREEMDWSIYLSRASSIRERQAGFLLLLRPCYLLGSLPCSWSHLLPERGR